MATVGQERHLRYILLMLEGGTLVLREILERETQKQSQSLEELLNANKRSMQHLLDRQSFDKVYSSGGVLDVSSWDISLLAKIILQLFKNNLTGKERSAIRSLKDQRNEQAHTSKLFMEENEYDDVRRELAGTLTTLSNGLDQAVRDKCQNVIQDSARGPLDHAARERLKELSIHDKQLLKELRKLTGEFYDVLQDIKRMLLDMIKNDMDFHSFRVIGTDMAIRGSNDDLTKLAEQLVIGVFETASERTGGDINIQMLTKAIEDILADIRQCDGVEFCSIEKHCIRLQAKSKSCRGLLELLEYLDGDVFKVRLQDLELALAQNVGSTFRVTATITHSSLTELENDLLVTEGDLIDQPKQTDCTHCSRKDCKIEELEEILQSSRIKEQENEDCLKQILQSQEDLQQRYKSEIKLRKEQENKYHDEKREKEKIVRRLRSNEQNITHISDPNRPSRIAEKMSELYQDQWKDAYHALESKRQQMGEKQIIQTLLDTLMDVHRECNRLASEHFFESVQRSIETPIGVAQTVTFQVVLPEKLKEQVKAFRKLRAPAVLKKIEMVVKKRIKTPDQELEEMQEYISSCIEIGWLCAVQDPPLVLKKEASNKFDSNTFNDYSKPGTYTEFVVLPALYLRDGGPLLAKGVAQGSNE